MCQLKLMSSVELTKTYHHLFPVPGFVERAAPAAAVTTAGSGGKVPGLADAPSDRCFGCAELLLATAKAAAAAAAAAACADAAATTGVACPSCARPFCASCDELVHSVLRTCPGCEMQII